MTKRVEGGGVDLTHAGVHGIRSLGVMVELTQVSKCGDHTAGHHRVVFPSPGSQEALQQAARQRSEVLVRQEAQDGVNENQEECEAHLPMIPYWVLL